MNKDCYIGVAQMLDGLHPSLVVEFGSLDINGNVNDLLGRAEYVGVDLVAGPNVTVIADAATYTPPRSPDVVLCLSVLEHTSAAKAIVANAWRILKPGGALIVAGPDPTWPPHDANGGPLGPGAYYKGLSEDDLRAMMSDFAEVETANNDQLSFARAVKAEEAPAGIIDRTIGAELLCPADRRLNVGCGAYPLAGWTNLDRNPALGIDICADALEYLRECQNNQYDEIYAGHLIEHLVRDDAVALIRECFRVLAPGGKLGLMVPDMREVFRRYLAGSVDAVQYPIGTWWPVADLDAVCALFIYSTVQESPHQWAWDMQGLARQMALAGFFALQEIDRHRDPRLGSPAWYQCGLDGRKPKETDAPVAVPPAALEKEAQYAANIAALEKVEERTR